MLGKLMKHEFKNTWTYMTLICVGIILSGILGGIIFRVFPYDKLKGDTSSIYGILLFYTAFTFLIIIVALNILAMVLIVVHYYKNLYTSQGYLSFTLPASITEVVSSRILVGCIWSLATSVATFIGIVITCVVGCSKYIPLVDYFNDFIQELFSELGTGRAISITIAYVVLCLINVFSKMLLYFFCISVGQLWQQHKILGAIACYFATNFIGGLVSLLLGIGNYAFMLTTYDYYSNLNEYINMSLVKGYVYALILGAILFIGAILVPNKKLNLD